MAEASLRKILKQGNSFCVSIPRNFVNYLHAQPGDIVEVITYKNTMCVTFPDPPTG